jgi:DNA-binding transcriptional LysR family regulator
LKIVFATQKVINGVLAFYEVSPHNVSMELRHLRYFMAVAEELHFGRAAARLNIAAPTLSQQIGALESMLGAKLFTRKTKTAVALTHPGKRFLIEAQATLRQAAQAEMVGRQAARGHTGSIAVGFILSAGFSGLMSSTLVKFRKTHPDVTFQICRMLTFAQYKAIADGSLDVGFSQAPKRYPSGLDGFIISRQPLWAAIPEGHPLAARKKITPAMLLEENFIALSMELETGFWGNIAAIMPAGVSPPIVERAPDAFTLMTLVAAGVGVSVLSEPFTHIAMPGIAFRKIVGAVGTADLAVVHRKNEAAPVVAAYIDFLRSQARLG